MKITRSLAALLVFLIASSPSLLRGAVKFRVGGSAAYYIPQEAVYKSIYGTGNLTFGTFLGLEIRKGLEIRAEFNYFRDNGAMTVNKEALTFTTQFIVAGLRIRVVNTRFFSPYLGLGIGSCSYKEQYPARLGDASGRADCTHAELGNYLQILKNIRFDINVRYVISKSAGDIKLGGLRTGIGADLSF